MDKHVNSHFDHQGRFIFRSFDRARPFSSFLPGIGGLFGIPMWVFYVNRGQAITSFGVESKDRPIMEFQPANKAYQLTATLGFRTFLKGDDWFVEPFSPWNQAHPQRDMYIGINEIEIRETNHQRAVETSVVYFNLLNEDFAGLVRQVSFRNLGRADLKFDLLDGMPALMPYGLDNGLLKNIGRTLEAWMEVFEVDSRIPFYRLRASAGDTSEVRSFESGNFALAFMDGELLPAYVDPFVVFGMDTSFSHPQGMTHGIGNMEKMHQITEGRTPCAFFGKSMVIKPGESKTVSSVYGFAENYQAINERSSKLISPNYIHEKHTEAHEFTELLTEPIATGSANPLFDAYARQTFLDNLIRGGWPEILADKHIYHVFSRKHGDPERDYNYFFLPAENFSQGNANFRDVNQNRRSDVFFEPRVEDFNIRMFLSLIQTDGYNPLVVQGTKFTLGLDKRAAILQQVESPENISGILSKEFTPGELLSVSEESDLKIPVSQFLDLVMGEASQHIQAEFGEGYWTDHWTYNLDLIESYLAIYPDKKSDLLFDSAPLPFYDSHVAVNPRAKKYVLDNGKPRQYNAIFEDPERLKLIKSRSDQPNWVRSKFGTGEIFKVNLFSKLTFLAILKFASRDPFGMGIEMEAGRPGWCDAMNGLPGLFGSSLSETFELLRLINFLIESLNSDPHEIALPVELEELTQEVLTQIDNFQNSFDYWDRVSNARETYRENTRLGVSGQMTGISAEDLLKTLEKLKAQLQESISRAVEENGGIPPTYYFYELTEFETEDSTDEHERPFIRPVRFTQTRLPLYLEGPVRQLKTIEDPDQALALYEKVRVSELYDKKLGMYRLNASLRDQPHEIGRARAFSPGWLENESIWLHMSYKYLLEILKAGLYDQFFEEIQTSMPPFMDPAVYGRSPLENSSFIVSGAHPDASLHGTGFVARLSGSTAEFLSIWNLIMTGPKPFVEKNGELNLCLRPALPGWFFKDDGKLTFRFLGRCEVTYHNSERKDTYSTEITVNKVKLHLADGIDETFTNGTIPTPYAEMVRSGEISAIEIYF